MYDELRKRGTSAESSARLFAPSRPAAWLDRVIEREAAIILRRLRMRAAGALMKEHELVGFLVSQVGRNHEALCAVGRAAEAVDLALEARIDGEDRLAQGFALDEIVGQLVERAIEIIVGFDVVHEHADEDFPVKSVVAIKREAGAFSDDDAVGALERHEGVGNRRGLVQHIEKDLQ